ncbi:oxidoreductase family protein [Colletotrichum asianum]|uniref:Oxidoreductase family protein n=1 Tax=Colletotrichum asianum TaxID=702518 RepID=A0A8H3VVA7_9PEZI|nr:oxidoreductase family protein [Colletotrichum asianum]
MNSTTICPDASGIPDFANIHDIPSNVSTGFVPIGRNGSYVAMSACCSPSAVSIASDCYYWCEIPTEEALDSFGSCLIRNGLERGIVGLHESGAASSKTRLNAGGLAVWALLVISAICLG